MTNPDEIDWSAYDPEEYERATPDEEKIGFSRMDVAGRTIATLDEETMDRIRAPIMERLASVENLLIEAIRDQQQAKGIYYCEECHGRVFPSHCFMRKDDDGVGRYWHHRCYKGEVMF